MGEAARYVPENVWDCIAKHVTYEDMLSMLSSGAVPLSVVKSGVMVLGWLVDLFGKDVALIGAILNGTPSYNVPRALRAQTKCIGPHAALAAVRVLPLPWEESRAAVKEFVRVAVEYGRHDLFEAITDRVVATGPTTHHARCALEILSDTLRLVCQTEKGETHMIRIMRSVLRCSTRIDHTVIVCGRFADDAICFATHRGSLDALRVLLSQGASPRCHDYAPLMNLTSRKYADPRMLDEMFFHDRGLDVTVRNGTAIVNAVCTDGGKDLLFALLVGGRNASTPFSGPQLDVALHTAIVRADHTCVERLLECPEVSSRVPLFQDGALYRAVNVFCEAATKRSDKRYDDKTPMLKIIELLTSKPHGARLTSRQNSLLTAFMGIISPMWHIASHYEIERHYGYIRNFLKIVSSSGSIVDPDLLPGVSRQLLSIAIESCELVTVQELLSLEHLRTEEVAEELLCELPEMKTPMVCGYESVDIEKLLVDTFAPVAHRFELRLGLRYLVKRCQVFRTGWGLLLSTRFKMFEVVKAAFERYVSAMNLEEKKNVTTTLVGMAHTELEDYSDSVTGASLTTEIASMVTRLLDGAMPTDLSLAFLMDLINTKNVRFRSTSVIRACWNHCKSDARCRDNLRRSADPLDLPTHIALRKHMFTRGSMYVYEPQVSDVLSALDLTDLRHTVGPTVVAIANDDLVSVRTYIQKFNADPEARAPYPLFPVRLTSTLTPANIFRVFDKLAEHKNVNASRQFQWEFCDARGTMPMVLLYAMLHAKKGVTYSKARTSSKWVTDQVLALCKRFYDASGVPSNAQDMELVARFFVPNRNNLLRFL
jgi:hypothetical protein